MRAAAPAAAEAAMELAGCLACQGDESGAAAARADVARLRAGLADGITTPLLSGMVLRTVAGDAALADL